jgi:hypothetical protein
MNSYNAANYLCIRALNEGEVVYRTIQLSNSLLVDIDRNGKIIGIEKIGDLFNIDDLIVVLKHLYWIGFYDE